MKILMLTPYLPFPLYSGGQIRTYNLLKKLSQKHEITLFSFIRDENEKQYIAELKKYCADVEVFLKRPPWSLTSLTLAALSFYPLVVCLYLRNSVKKFIDSAIKRKHFDLIHAETFYVMPNIPQNNIPIILAEQTIEYLVYQHFTESVKLLPKKLLMDWDVKKIYFWERRFWSKADRVVAMSLADKKIMQEAAPKLTVDLVPNGVDTEFFQKRKPLKSSRTRTVLFVGNFKWLQNREAVSILVNSVWPIIKKKVPDTKLWIVGRFPPENIKSYASDSIIISDGITDIREAYKKADVLLAPIYGPGGTRYKILEAMATGLPVVTTSTGIEGLNCKTGKEALISATPEGLAAEAIKVITSPSLYKKLAQNGRKLVEQYFNWEMIAKKLDHIYKEAVYAKKS